MADERRHRGGRYQFLDLLRGLAALAVLVTHYRWFFARFPGDSTAADGLPLPGRAILGVLYDHGHLAVQLFWVLSGFVFANTYIVHGERFNARRFAANRIARLYPLHLLMLLAVALLQIVSLRCYGQWQLYPNNDLPHFIAQLGMASNWFTDASSFNFPVWSVSVEILIYFAFMAYMAAIGYGWRSFFMVFVAFLLLERLTYNVIALCGVLFFLGGLLCRITEAAMRWQPKGARLLVSTAGGLVAASLTLCILLHGRHVELLFSYLVAPSLVLLAAGLDRSCLRFPMRLSWVGEVTYSVYMCHIPLIMLARILFPAFLAQRDVLLSGVMLATYLLVVMLVARALLVWFELPVQRYLRLHLAPAASPIANPTDAAEIRQTI